MHRPSIHRRDQIHPKKNGGHAGMESDPPVLDTRLGITLKIATELSGGLLEKPKIVIICGPSSGLFGLLRDHFFGTNIRC
jgi:hypothetical protein